MKLIEGVDMRRGVEKVNMMKWFVVLVILVLVIAGGVEGDVDEPSGGLGTSSGPQMGFGFGGPGLWLGGGLNGKKGFWRHKKGFGRRGKGFGGPEFGGGVFGGPGLGRGGFGGPGLGGGGFGGGFGGPGFGGPGIGKGNGSDGGKAAFAGTP